MSRGSSAATTHIGDNIGLELQRNVLQTPQSGATVETRAGLQNTKQSSLLERHVRVEKQARATTRCHMHVG